MERDKLLRALRATAADQHRCFGCGYEDKCSIHGCAINRAAAELIEQLAAENEALRRPPNPLQKPPPQAGRRRHGSLPSGKGSVW